MVGLSEEPVQRRKRVAKACETCRGMKSKCDGRYPFCRRCVGYGYKCVYSGASRRGLRVAVEPSRESASEPPLSTPAVLREAVAGYDKLVRDVAPDLPGPSQVAVLDTLASINGHVEKVLSSWETTEAGPSASSASSAPGALPSLTLRSRTPLNNSPRYLGETSDVGFFNLVNQVLHMPGQTDEGMSYEQDDPATAKLSPTSLCPGLPSPVLADAYLDIYFSTVHISYPFLPRSDFMRIFEKLRDSGSAEDIEPSWLATLYTIFAIGSYYLSFNGEGRDKRHEQYFLYSQALCNADSRERSIGQVSCLHMQCVYLLAVCRTDRCWTTLGLAVRLAQSIGLHVEYDETNVPGATLETRRRVWYALYVLDRLLSLQLGRPPAIHDDDCTIPLPMPISDNYLDEDASSTGDYFPSVIYLSRIISGVLRDLYGAQRSVKRADRLFRTAALDEQLLDWKRRLPRALRFDFGHVFEKSVVLRRQRNMLAVKFHHLRALIYRPYLCLPFLRSREDASVASSDAVANTIDMYEKTCIAEAQELAHLLRNLNDERDLVHEFPWLQMISCLICASSILVVASTFGRRGDDDVDLAVLGDDAETCMQVFEALSAGSDGASIARDMMTRLGERGRTWRECRGASGPGPAGPEGVPAVVGDPMQPLQPAGLLVGQPGPEDLFGMQNWPPEIVDSMAWSAQFFGVANLATF